MKLRYFSMASALAFASFVSSTGHAALESCGGVFIFGDADCRFIPEHEECETSCQITSVEQSCAASLYTHCEAGCSASASTVCTETCTPVCVETCVQAPTTTSRGGCRSDCAADCDVKCATA